MRKRAARYVEPMALLTIGAGVVLILLAMRYLRKGLDRLFGRRLLDWVRAATEARGRAFFAGLAFGTVAPSSTSLAVLSTRMLRRSPAPPLAPMLAIVLGANVGLTVTVQFLALRLDQAAAPLLVAGGAAFLFARASSVRGAGQVLLALGLLFLALPLIGGAARAIVAEPAIAGLLELAARSPLALVCATAVLTLALQSSTASIALGLSLAQADALPTAALLPWVVGTNLGICTTALIAGWSNSDARRLGVANLALKSLGGAAALAAAATFAPGGAWASAVPPDRFAADLHTGFNLVLGLVGLLALHPLTALARNLVPDASPESDDGTEFLDPQLLQSPSLALNQATRETFRLVDELAVMLRDTRRIVAEENPSLAARIAVGHRRCVMRQRLLLDFLSRIEEDALDRADAHWKPILADYGQDLLACSLLVRRDLTDTALRTLAHGRPWPEAIAPALDELYRRTLARLEAAVHLLMTRDSAEAAAFIADKEALSQWCRRLRRERQDRRLGRGEGTDPRLDALYYDHLDILRRLNSHLTSAAYAIAGRIETGPEEPAPCLNEA